MHKCLEIARHHITNFKSLPLPALPHHMNEQLVVKMSNVDCVLRNVQAHKSASTDFLNTQTKKCWMQQASDCIQRIHQTCMTQCGPGNLEALGTKVRMTVILSRLPQMMLTHLLPLFSFLCCQFACVRNNTGGSNWCLHTSVII